MMDGHYCDVGSVVDRMERSIARAFSEKDFSRETGYYSKEHEEKKAYHMIPKHNGFFDGLIKSIKKYFPYSVEWKDRNFIDVGAGCGFRVLQAMQQGFNATGVEFYKKYVLFAKKYLELSLIHDDAFNLDYSKYNVVYFYHPIANRNLEVKLEEKISEDLKPGTFILTGMSSSKCWLNSKKYETISDGVIWRKK